MAALSGVGDGWGVRRVSRSLLDASSKSEGDLVRCGDDGEKLETDDDDDDNIHSFGGDSDNDDDDEGKEGGSMGTASVQHKGMPWCQIGWWHCHGNCQHSWGMSR